MSEGEQLNGVSRRAVLGGIGAGAGLGVLAAGLPAGVASAAPSERWVPAAGLASLQTQATPLSPALRYVVLSGHDFAPLSSGATSNYSTLDGQFRFASGSSGYASVRPNLPLGSVIEELELYGMRTATGSISLELWQSAVTAGTVKLASHTTVPAVAGPFTVTLPCNDEQTALLKSTPFVNIDAIAAPGTAIFGIRIGYTAPSAFVPLPTSVAPRVYDSRTLGSKLASGEERAIALPVPPGVGAAVFTLTVTETEGEGGYVAVFPSGITWPGNSSINWSTPDQNIANTVVSALGADSKIVLRGGANRTHVIVDVAGWIA